MKDAIRKLLLDHDGKIGLAPDFSERVEIRTQTLDAIGLLLASGIAAAEKAAQSYQEASAKFHGAFNPAALIILTAAEARPGVGEK